MTKDILRVLQLDDPHRTCFVIPFAGLLAPGTPRLVGCVLLTYQNWEQWRLLEHTAFVEKHLVPGYVPPMVVGIFTVEGKQTQRRAWKRAEVIRDATALSLRLAGCPEFVEPRLVALYSANDPSYTREPGPYRQAMLSGMFDLSPRPPKRKTLKDADALYRKIVQWIADAKETELSPVSLYRQSYGPFLRAGDRLLFLFAAMEALMLPWREKVSGTSLEDRISLAARLGNAQPAAQIATGAARNARNTLAHGEPREDAFSPIVAPLQETMRGALRSWIEFRHNLPCLEKPTIEFNLRLATAITHGMALEEAATYLFAQTPS
jgi:hypothetical protein